MPQRLDEVPNGFPATANGAERRSLRKLFTPEEAALFEGYLQASRSFDVPGPRLRRVISVREADQHDVKIHPYEQAAAMIENCLVFAPVEGAFDGSATDRALSVPRAGGCPHVHRLRIVRGAVPVRCAPCAPGRRR